MLTVIGIDIDSLVLASHWGSTVRYRHRLTQSVEQLGGGGPLKQDVIDICILCMVVLIDDFVEAGRRIVTDRNFRGCKGVFTPQKKKDKSKIYNQWRNSQNK